MTKKRTPEFASEFPEQQFKINTPETVEQTHESPEVQLELERARAKACVEAFQKAVETVKESFRLNDYFHSLTKMAHTIERIVAESSDAEGATDAFLSKLAPLSKRLRPQIQEIFTEWVRQACADQTSWLYEVQQNFLFTERMKTEIAHELIFINHAGLEKRLADMPLDSTILRRFEHVTKLTKGCAEEYSFPAEAIFQEFFVQMSHQRTTEQKTRPKKGLEHVFGKKSTTVPEQFEKLLEELDPAYANAAYSGEMTNRARLKYGISESRLTPAGQKRRLDGNRVTYVTDRLKSARDAMRGTEVASAKQENVKTTGLDAYKEHMNLDDSFDYAVDALSPILGDQRFVRALTFDTKQSAKNEHAAGLFEPSSKKMSLHPFPQSSQTDCVRILAHESGHAMRVEENLSLYDAIEYGISMRINIYGQGFVSRYSAVAQELYAMQMINAGATATNMTKRDTNFLKDADVLEEWAEMVAFGLVPSGMERVYPEKDFILRTYMNKMGLDVDKIRERMDQAIGSNRASQNANFAMAS